MPEDGQAIRRAFQRIEITIDQDKLQYHAHFWPPSELLSLLALAQHSGIATRLADWSSDPYVAAYFAASGTLSNTAPRVEDRVAIWKLLLVAVEGQEYLHGVEREDWPVRVITAPTAENSNLRAQRGVFTLHNVIRLQPSQPRDAPALDDLLKDSDPLPPLGKLTLPVSEAPELLRLLSRHGYHAGSLFPGFEGVARLLRERRRLQELM